MRQQSRSVLKALASILVAALAATGCSNGSKPETSTVTFAVEVDESLGGSIQKPSGGPGQVSYAFSYSDINRILVDVKETASGAVVYVNFDLTQTAGVWTGTLPFLPQDRSLTFIAHAIKAGTEVFTGSTTATLTMDNENVNIVLAPTNDGQTISLPRILKISIPSAFVSSQSGNISFYIQGNTGEQMSYTLTEASSGGTFFPMSGAITLAATSGTFVSRYLPPTVSEVTEYTHQVRVTNSTGHSVSTTFKTRVLPPSVTQGARDITLSVLFNPVINNIQASRVLGTGDVIWEATVADDGPESELTYQWGFSPSGTFDPAPGFTGQTNPTTLQNYTPLVQGTLTLAVTDINGGTTTLSYPLTPNQFPDEPTEVGAPTGFNAISGGGYHTCVLMNNGTVRCWGWAASGQLGYGNTFNIGDDELPYTAGDVPIVGVATKLAVGGEHTCVLLDSGFVRCWGRNTYGQLGYNTTENVGDGEAIAGYYVNLGGTATRIAAGGNHTCALMDTGNVRCWGRNNYGQLGYGNTNNVGDNEQPWVMGDVSVGGAVQDIAAGSSHTCALLTTGKVRCWGWGGYGQLGYGNTANIGDNELPSSAGDVDLGGTAIQISAQGDFTCALLDTGYVRCWGFGGYGQLGYGNYANIGDDELPYTAGDVNTGGGVLQVTTGWFHTCALLDTGIVKCWGYDHVGQLGYGGTPWPWVQAAPPAEGVNLGGSTAFQVSAGYYHTCALLATGNARCWGYGAYGQLGYGNTENIGDNEVPSTAGDIVVFWP